MDSKKSTTETTATANDAGDPADMKASTSPSWMKTILTDGPDHQPLTPNQRTSIAAMIAYVANRSGQSEVRVERTLSDRFRVANPSCLQSSLYDDAIRYLADISDL